MYCRLLIGHCISGTEYKKPTKVALPQEGTLFRTQFTSLGFLSSPIACVACKRTELLRTEITGGRCFDGL